MSRPRFAVAVLLVALGVALIGVAAALLDWRYALIWVGLVALVVGALVINVERRQ